LLKTVHKDKGNFEIHTFEY